jgi:DNA gyrase subunit A
MGRNTRGVKGINLQGGDEVVGMVVADPEGFLLTVCEKGYGKRTPFGANSAGVEASDSELEETVEVPDAAAEPAEPSELAEPGEEERSAMRYRKQRRGGKGVRDIRTSDRNGPVVGVVSVRNGDDVMFITSQGMVNRTPADEIRIVGRNTQGVRVMGVEEGDRIVSLAKVAREEGETPVADEPSAETDGQSPAQETPPTE